MAFSNAMADHSTMYISQLDTGYTIPPGYDSGYDSGFQFSPPMNPPFHAPTQGRYFRDPFPKFEVYSLPTPTDLAQDAGFSPYGTTFQTDNANMGPPPIGKRGRGRPKGSKNKDKNAEKPEPKPRGRPEGSKDSKPRAPYGSVKAARDFRRAAAAPQEHLSPASLANTASTFDPASLTPESEEALGDLWDAEMATRKMVEELTAGGAEPAAMEEETMPAPNNFQDDTEMEATGATGQHGINIDNIDPALTATIDWKAIETHLSNNNLIDTQWNDIGATGQDGDDTNLFGGSGSEDRMEEFGGIPQPEYDMNAYDGVDGNTFSASF